MRYKRILDRRIMITWKEYFLIMPSLSSVLFYSKYNKMYRWCNISHFKLWYFDYQRVYHLVAKSVSQSVSDHFYRPVRQLSSHSPGLSLYQCVLGRPARKDKEDGRIRRYNLFEKILSQPFCPLFLFILCVALTYSILV